MLDTFVNLHADDVVAPVNRRVFGSFVEHMGRCVYTGIFEPGHVEADENGFRQDVLALVRELGVTLVRYPGGNFVSGYRWEDGVGPVEERPTRLDYAWRSTETNEFGLNEFMAWAKLADVEPMMALNLGTRGIQEALDLLEYTNHPAGTALADQRIAHGVPDPHDVRVWCLGNEMDGPWQLGHKTAEEYGRLAAETARAMRQFDPGLELVACGSSGRGMATFGAWEATVLEHTYELVDFISAHAYYQCVGDDYASFLASSVDMATFIADVTATADHVGARLNSSKTMKISFDEWNVWYQRELEVPEDWAVAPRLSENDYTVVDAVVVGSLLITLLRHGDRVTAACLAQLVNTISPIRAEPDGPSWRQATFHPFAEMARHARGQVMLPRITAPTMSTEQYGEVATLDCVATYDDATGTLVLFAVNRSPVSPARLRVDLAEFSLVGTVDAVVLHDADFAAANTQEDPDRVRLRAQQVDLEEGVLLSELPPASWSRFIVDVAR
ncbi:alpha-N-arabinofuranosidase [Georgenia sp. MJ173]|uniref:arabinosylfuranosidase ArfA n=1 Tax=Georgenia sunbinii TaxID=3117728 RepID=UPI002F268DA0